MSDSLSVITDSTLAPAQSQSDQSDTTTAVPLLLAPSPEEIKNNESNLQLLPQLPSHRFKYSVWHDLTHTDIRGDQLKAPRVRAGPPVKELMFYKLIDDNNKHIHHSRKGKERVTYTSQTENWENTEFCNLSYQELSHAFQKENFIRILKKLIRVVELNLLDDNLQDLHTVTFPKCTHLNLSRNYISSFKKLPHIPQIRFLIISENGIPTLDGLEMLKKTPIEYLNLKGNPVTFIECYRRRVFKILPQLKILDDIPKLDDDSLPPEVKGASPTCVIS